MDRKGEPAARPDGLVLGRRSLLKALGVAGFGVIAAGGGWAVGREMGIDAGQGVRAFDSSLPILISNVTILPVAPDPRSVIIGSVLVENGMISAVGADVRAPESAQRIDGLGKVLIPGLVDTHRHAWQTPFRSLGSNWNLAYYISEFLMPNAPTLTAEDFYNGTLMGLVDGIDAGTTTTLDWAHGFSSLDQVEAGLQAAIDSGARVHFAFGLFGGNVPPEQWVLDPRTRNIIDRARSAGPLISVGLALDPTARPGFPDAPAWQWAKDNDVPIAAHAGVYGFNAPSFLSDLESRDLLLPSTVYAHASWMSDDDYRRIADSGGHISIAPESEFNFGQGYPPTAQVAQFGLQASISSDTVLYQSSDLFAAMRAIINGDRALTNLRAQEAGQPVPRHTLLPDDVLQWATQGGMRALQYENAGTIEVGAIADLVLVDMRTTGTALGDNYPQGAVVLQAGRAEVDTVIIGGQVKKYNGALIGVDTQRVRRLGEETRDRILETIPPETLERLKYPPAE